MYNIKICINMYVSKAASQMSDQLKSSSDMYQSQQHL